MKSCPGLLQVQSGVVVIQDNDKVVARVGGAGPVVGLGNECLMKADPDIFKASIGTQTDDGAPVTEPLVVMNSADLPASPCCLRPRSSAAAKVCGAAGGVGRDHDDRRQIC